MNETLFIYFKGFFFLRVPGGCWDVGQESRPLSPAAQRPPGRGSRGFTPPLTRFLL